MTFDEMITNTGDDFNLTSNVFTCRIPGLYVFSWSVRKGGDTTRPDIELQKNGVRVARVYLLNEKDPEQNSNTITLELEASDEVKLVVKLYSGIMGRIYNDDRRYSTFTGYLLYRNYSGRYTENALKCSKATITYYYE